MNCIAWSADGLLLAAASKKEIKIYNTKSWMPEKEIQLKSPAVDLDFDKDRLFIGEEDGHCTIIPNLNQIKKNVSKSVKPSKPLKGKVAILEKLVFAITFEVLRILTEHIQ